MMRRLLLVFGIISVVSGAAVLSFPAETHAAKCDDRVLTFPTWYRGVASTTKAANGEDTCAISPPKPDGNGLGLFIAKIGLNIVELMLQLVGYVCVGYIIFGGFKYIASGGDPANMSKAKMTIQNAVTGLIISIASVGIVMSIAGALK